MGLTDANPVFSWNLVSSDFKRKNIRQIAYQIIVSSSLERLNQNFGDLWDSEMIRSSSMSNVIYQGKGFRSSRKYWWKVRIWDELNKTSRWSEPATFITGVMRPSDWQSQWIGTSTSAVNVLFRNEFEFRKNLKLAVLHISSSDFFDLRINGNALGDGVLLSGNAYFSESLQYRTFELTDQLWKGINTMAVSVFKRSKSRTASIIAQLNLVYEDGSVEILVTDKNWKVSEGPVNTNSNGSEIVNANLIPKSWDKSFFTYNQNWQNAHERSADLPVGSILPMFKMDKVQTIKDQAKWSKNTRVYDFGSLSFVLPTLRLSGAKGSKVEIIPMEDIPTEELSMDSDSIIPFIQSKHSIAELWQLQYSLKRSRIFPDSIQRSTILKDSNNKKKWTYILKGEGDELFNARFTPENARYFIVQLFPAPSDTILPKVLQLEANLVETDFQKLGEFYSSNENLDFNFDSITRSLDSRLIQDYIKKTQDSVVDWSNILQFSGSLVYFKNYFPLLSEYLDQLKLQIKNPLVAKNILKQSWMNYLFTANNFEVGYYHPKLKPLFELTDQELQLDSLHQNKGLVRLTELFYRSSNVSRDYVESSKWENRNLIHRRHYGFSKADSLTNRYGRIYSSKLDFSNDTLKDDRKLPEIYMSETAGIGVDDYGRGAGFKKIIIKPVFREDVTQVSASYQSVSGYVGVSWKLLLSKLSLDISVPPNTQALLHIPIDVDRNFRERGIPNEQSLNVRYYGEIEGYTIYEVDSGNYGFILSLQENSPYFQSQLNSLQK